MLKTNPTPMPSPVGPTNGNCYSQVVSLDPRYNRSVDPENHDHDCPRWPSYPWHRERSGSVPNGKSTSGFR